VVLKETTLFGIEDKVAQSVRIMKEFEPKEGYYLAFSGGKDSCVLKEVANMGGIKYDAHYSVTTIDPPELVRFIKQYHSDVAWEFPEEPLLKRMVQKGFWMRQHRWCCGEYKERGGDKRVVLVGVRKAESAKRKAMSVCSQWKGKKMVRPILYWSDRDVWEFIRQEGLPYCSLYDEGFKRLGCLFCPMASKKMRKHEVDRYPNYVRTFKIYFQKLWENKQHLESYRRWSSGEDLFNWWISGRGGKSKEDICYSKQDLFYGD
jgi:phosphoadenosine phosphosulfate reductase